MQLWVRGPDGGREGVWEQVEACGEPVGVLDLPCTGPLCVSAGQLKE